VQRRLSLLCSATGFPQQFTPSISLCLFNIYNTHTPLYSVRVGALLLQRVSPSFFSSALLSTPNALVRAQTKKKRCLTCDRNVGSTVGTGQHPEEGKLTRSRVLQDHADHRVESQVVDAIKDLVQDCNFDCNDSGIALQAMDNSHVALVSMMLKAEGFSPYRCDRNIALGVNLTSLTKVLRAAQGEDILTLKAEDAPDVLNLTFESSENDRISEYDLKLMDIDQEHLGIPETEYAATITMPAAEFRRICTDLAAMSESGM
jgi:hypothetical protein